ncbi:hypothetical protein J6590_035301 [Homalodisca vitripennis]|nr:hypothetical protein J6590_035301 [Homalodisca vitripennis]
MLRLAVNISVIISESSLSKKTTAIIEEWPSLPLSTPEVIIQLNRLQMGALKLNWCKPNSPMRVDRWRCAVTTHRLAHIAGQGSHLSVTQHACCSQGLPERVRPTLPSGIQQTVNAAERPGLSPRTHALHTHERRGRQPGNCRFPPGLFSNILHL